VTECNRKSMSFSRLGRQKIVAEVDGGRLSSDGGGLLLREVDRQLGLTASLAGCIADPRDPAKITHDLKTLLAQRVFGIALGYEDLNDHETLRDDPLFAILAEQRPDPEAPLGSPSTLCRFENAVTREPLSRMSEVFVEQFIASHKRPPKELVLDFDPTDDLVHGNQEGRFFHGYYDAYCFLPLYVFCGDQLLVAYLRPSNIDGAMHSRAIRKLLVQRLRRVWPKVRIIFRGDSGFCRWKLLRWCDKHDVGYVVGLARNKVLERMAQPFMDEAKKAFDESGVKQRNFHEITYAAKTWDRERRVAVKAEVLAKGPNVRFVVMLLDLPGESTRPRFGKHWPLAAAAGLSFAALAWLGRVETLDPTGPGIAGVVPGAEGMAAEGPPLGSLSEIGMALFGPFALPFEMASLVLLAAIVGAVILARGRAAGS